MTRWRYESGDFIFKQFFCSCNLLSNSFVCESEVSILERLKYEGIQISVIYTFILDFLMVWLCHFFSFSDFFTLNLASSM